MDANITTIILALIAAVVVPIVTTTIKWLQDKSIAKDSAERNAVSDKKLDGIHELVNSQLTEAVERFEKALKQVAALQEEIAALKRLLLKKAPNDPRVKELTKKA